MTGQELVDIIVKNGMLDKPIDLSNEDSEKLVFAISEKRDPNNEDNVEYTDFVIDFVNKTGKYDTWRFEV